MVKNKIVWKDTVEGKEVEFAVVRPTPKQLTEAQKVYNRAFRDALESGAMLRQKLDDVMRKQGLWDDDKQAEYDGILRKYKELEFKLARGKMHKDEGKKIALEMKKLRNEMSFMLANRNNLDTHTAEAQADNVRFNSLVSMCFVYNSSGKVVFNSLDDYLSHSTEEWVFKSANHLYTLMSDLDEEYENKHPENKFLVKFGYVDAKLRLIDKEGNFIDEDGKRIDENGNYVDANGKFVNKFGQLIDAEGNLIVEDAGAFFDDDGSPIN